MPLSRAACLSGWGASKEGQEQPESLNSPNNTKMSKRVPYRQETESAGAQNNPPGQEPERDTEGPPPAPCRLAVRQNPERSVVSTPHPRLRQGPQASLQGRPWAGVGLGAGQSCTDMGVGATKGELLCG